MTWKKKQPTPEQKDEAKKLKAHLTLMEKEAFRPATAARIRSTKREETLLLSYHIAKHLSLLTLSNLWHMKKQYPMPFGKYYIQVAKRKWHNGYIVEVLPTMKSETAESLDAQGWYTDAYRWPYGVVTPPVHVQEEIKDLLSFMD